MIIWIPLLVSFFQSVMLYLQKLTDHKNASLAYASRYAYYALLKRYAEIVSNGKKGVEKYSALVVTLSSALMRSLMNEDASLKQLSFSLKGLSLISAVRIKPNSVFFFYHRIENIFFL